MPQNHPNAQNLIHHLARLNDGVFALVMALTFMGLHLPDSVLSMSNSEINRFLMGQLRSLGVDITTFILVAFYWISHIQQLSYYKRTNEIHLSIHALYLMSLLIVPFSNTVVFYISGNALAKILFSANIFLIGMLSFVSWIYATTQRRLIDQNLDRQIIRLVAAKALIEPACASLVIAIALINSDLSDFAWLLVPVAAFVVDKTISVDPSEPTTFINNSHGSLSPLNPLTQAEPTNLTD